MSSIQRAGYISIRARRRNRYRTPYQPTRRGRPGRSRGAGTR
ncbi:MAG: hypothetical protein AAF892_17740 [Cyanobacteria bacterium P01_D01_bin.71]